MEGRAKVEALKCERCGKVWLPRQGKLPMTCPKCRTPYWQRKRIKRPAKKELQE